MPIESPERRVKLIFNPHADHGRAWRVAGSLQATIEHHGGAEWTGTEYPTHATKLAAEAARQGFDVVVAVGGDGTVHEVVNGLMVVPSDQRPALAIVPLGTGNDFSFNNQLPSDPDTAILRALSGQPTAVDLGLVRDDSGRIMYWHNVLGIGFDAAALINSLAIGRLQGFPLYLAAAVQTILRDLEAPHLKITTDAEEIDAEPCMLVLCNGAREGGGFHVAPDAVPDDGVFDYTLVDMVSRPMMFRLLPEFLRGTHGRFGQVRLGRFRELKLAADRPLLIHTDGEVFAKAANDVRELTVEILPHTLQLIR